MSLRREVFRTSRLLDFLSEKELVAQTGHSLSEWPLVAEKELYDNVLDACEDAGVAPCIAMTVDKDGIAVADNGPGFPPELVEGVIDFSTRVSSREGYVSPTRGAQGNALMALVAMPFVLDGERGCVEIASQGVRHEIVIAVDRIRQLPVVEHAQTADSRADGGTVVRVGWPESASSLAAVEVEFLQLADAFTWLNPHLDLTVDWFAERRLDLRATDPTWRKWLPSHPTSAHWYGVEHLERLVAAYVAHDADTGRERTVREFVGEFDGLTGTAKQRQVLEATGLARMSLADLVIDGGLDRERIKGLLAVMRHCSKPVSPARLGPLGRAHLQARAAAIGAVPESFRYDRRMGTTAAGLPAIVETAFAYLPGQEGRRLVAGVNWSPGIRNPFRSLGPWGQSLDDALRKQFVSRAEPVLQVAHLICPRVSYTDRGKSAVAL